MLRYKFFTVKPPPRDGMYVFLTNGTYVIRYTLQTDATVPLPTLNTPVASLWGLGNSVFVIIGPTISTTVYRTCRYNFASQTSLAGPLYQGVGYNNLDGGGSSNAFIGVVTLSAANAASYGTTNRMVFADYTFTTSTRLISPAAQPGSAIGNASVAVVASSLTATTLEKYVYDTEAISITTALTNSQAVTRGTSLRAEDFGLFITSNSGRVTEKYRYANESVSPGTALLGSVAFRGGGGNGVTGVLAPETTTGLYNKYTYASDTVVSTIFTGRPAAFGCHCDGTLGVNV